MSLEQKNLRSRNTTFLKEEPVQHAAVATMETANNAKNQPILTWHELGTRIEPLEHRADALSFELRELMESKVI